VSSILLNTPSNKMTVIKPGCFNSNQQPLYIERSKGKHEHLDRNYAAAVSRCQHMPQIVFASRQRTK